MFQISVSKYNKTIYASLIASLSQQKQLLKITETPSSISIINKFVADAGETSFTFEFVLKNYITRKTTGSNESWLRKSYEPQGGFKGDGEFDKDR